MKNKFIQELERIIVLCVNHNLPQTQILWMKKENYEEMCKEMKMLSSSAVCGITLEGSLPELVVDRIQYGGFIFDIIPY